MEQPRILRFSVPVHGSVPAALAFGSFTLAAFFTFAFCTGAAAGTSDVIAAGAA